jgi:hypothetical protein
MKRYLTIFLVMANSAWAARWQCELPGGTYVVDTTRIVSVSTHEYIVDGAARVTELTVATTSAVTARFYYLEPLAKTIGGERGQQLFEKVEERITGLAERAGQEPVWKKVVKNYPTTTHAHTVEYRLDTKADVQKLYDSVMTAWKQNRDVTYKPSSE